MKKVERKKEEMSKKKRFKPIFKRHKINGHPSYIYDECEDQYKYIGITHAKITQGVKNKKLHCNPNSKDTRQSYMHPFSTHDKKKNFKSSELKDYKFKKRIRKPLEKE